MNKEATRRQKDALEFIKSFITNTSFERVNS